MPAPPTPGAAPRRGVWLYPGVAAGALVEATVAAEEAGLDEVWIADEGVARDPMAVLAAAARATSTIRLAVGITSPVLRHPGALAASAATLDELSDGRAVLGLGLGGELSLAPFGLDADKPVQVLREAIVTARAVLAGAEVEHYRPSDHVFTRPGLPIWVGARGPQLVRLTGRLADGLFVSGCDPATHAPIIERLRASGGAEVALYQSVADDSAGDPTVVSWRDAGRRLSSECAAHRPEAIGLALVELTQGQAAPDPTVLVERAAEILLAAT